MTFFNLNFIYFSVSRNFLFSCCYYCKVMCFFFSNTRCCLYIDVFFFLSLFFSYSSFFFLVAFQGSRRSNVFMFLFIKPFPGFHVSSLFHQLSSVSSFPSFFFFFFFFCNCLPLVVCWSPSLFFFIHSSR